MRGDTRAAVTYCLEKTGRMVTAAALLLAIVCVAMAFSEVSFTELTGVGLALTVLLDATLIRAVLMPAAMRLMGKWNCWAPAPLHELHARIEIREEILVGV